MNPAAIASIASAVLPFFTTARAPSQAQIDAALAQQRADEHQKWIIGGGLAAGALVLFALASRRR